MSSISKLIDLGAKLLEDADPSEVVYDGNTWTGIAIEVTYSRGRRISGGQTASTVGSVQLRVSVVGDVVLVKGSEITVDGIKYYIGEIKTDTSTHTIELKSNNTR
jgi:hypothetical protein